MRVQVEGRIVHRKKTHFPEEREKTEVLGTLGKRPNTVRGEGVKKRKSD